MVLQVDGWSEFFVASAGAAAALAGLLFVALSINVREILAYPWLPARAASTVALLIGALVVACVALLPGLDDPVLGVVLLVATALTWAVPTLLRVRAHRGPTTTPHPQAVNLMLVQAATLPGIVGSVMVIGGSANGLYALAVGIILSFVVAVVNAWVLLIEILR